jgi:hypothetical protein
MDPVKVELREIEDTQEEDTKITLDYVTDTKEVLVKSEAEKNFVRKLNNNILPLIFFIMLCQV